MKRNLMAIILTLCMILCSCAGAEGLLPSLTETIGKPMPSLGEALRRYPDEELPADDGGNTEVFQNVTETDFNTFSVYLEEKGASLTDYQTTGSAFSASILVNEKTISFTYDMQSLEATVTYPKGTYDEWLDYAKVQYDAAVELLNAGKTDEVLETLRSIPNYQLYGKAVSLLSDNPGLKYAVGNYVTFGHYPQTSAGNDSTAIEWLVLERDDVNNRVLLISRYGLDAKAYNEEKAEVTWEICTLRVWLNNDFLNTAFSADEQKAILLTNVDNGREQGNSGRSTDGGNNTQDKVFLLSYAEAWKYFANDVARKCAPTDYAVKQGAYASRSNKTAEGKNAGYWWLRSPGNRQSYAADVYSGGALNFDIVSNVAVAVRPALWIDLESGIF